MSAFGILLGLLEREKTGFGQIIDHSLTDSTLYLCSYLLSMKRAGAWNEERGKNHLDTGAPYYGVYECKDGKFLCVGAIEDKFYRSFLEGLGFEKLELEEMVKKQMKRKEYEETGRRLKEIIKGKNSKEWQTIVYLSFL